MLGVGEGGALCTDSDEVAERVRRLRSQGMSASTIDRQRGKAMGYDVEELGYNYRFDDLRASLLRSRFARLGGEVERRRELIGRYRELLGGHELLGIAYGTHDVSRSSCYLMGILVEPELRSKVRNRLNDEHGIQTTVYPATHQLTAYVADLRRGLAAADRARRLLAVLDPAVPAPHRRAAGPGRRQPWSSRSSG